MKKVSRLELVSWAMYDFANSGYTTVVLTTIYNAYFVGIIAISISDGNSGLATLLWTLAVAISNGLVLISAPVLGSIADHTASKKVFLMFTTFGCVVFTAMLAIPGQGDIVAAMLLLILSNLMFASGENFIAAFLPEISKRKDMGKISGYGWSLGYIGGLLVLLLCLAYVTWAQSRGHSESEFVPVTMLIVAAIFLLAATPTLLWLRERATPITLPQGSGYIRAGFNRLKMTLLHIHHFRDLFRFMIALTVYTCGIYTVVILAAVYAREVMGFDTRQTIYLIIIVNITASVGAFVFGHVQDRLGSIRTLMLTLVIWIAAIAIVVLSDNLVAFWVAANLIGLGMGSCQSAGRALIGLFTPQARSGEFFGLWGLAVKLASVIGPVSYGLVSYLTAGNHRIAIISTLVFFMAGLLLLTTIDEQRGIAAAQKVY